MDCGGYPGRLRELLGVWVEESDALPFGEQNAITYSGTRYPADLMCDLMHLEGAQALANYEEDFYAGTPAVTVNKYGLGKAYYVGTHSDEMFYQTWMRELCAQTGVSPIQHTPAGVEAAVRENSGGRYLFFTQPYGRRKNGRAGRIVSRPAEWQDVCKTGRKLYWKQGACTCSEDAKRREYNRKSMKNWELNMGI